MRENEFQLQALFRQQHPVSGRFPLPGTTGLRFEDFLKLLCSDFKCFFILYVFKFF